MPRPCSCCAHAQRAAIDADLEAGASIDAVAERFGLNRSSVQRHKVGHLGRAVTFILPPTSPPAPAPPVQAVAASPDPETPPHVPAVAFIDSTAALDRLFARATAGPGHSIQDYLRLTLDGISHVYAKADAIGDLRVAAAALRELRALLQFHALVEPRRLSVHPGWQEPPLPPDPLHHLMAYLTAPLASDPASVEAAAVAGLEATDPEWAADLASDIAERNLEYGHGEGRTQKANAGRHEHRGHGGRAMCRTPDGS